MNDEATAILALIADPNALYDAKRQQMLQLSLETVRQAAEQGAEGVGPMVELIRKGVETPNAPKRILLASALAEITGEPEWFDRLFDDASAPGVSFDNRHTLLMHLGYLLFRNRGKLREADHFRLQQVRYRTLFGQLVEEMEAALGASSLLRSSAPPTPGRVVILTPQYLAPPHAPTMRAIEYAITLIDSYGKTPVIVESHVAPRSSPIAIVPPYASNRNEGLKPIDVLDLGGRSVEYYRAASESFTLSDLVHTTALISALSPELVIAISCPFLPAEAAALRAPTFVQPTTSALPITVRAATFAWNAPSAEEREILARFGVSDRLRFHMHPGFTLPQEAPPVSRAELGLAGDAFVFAVVGNRLHDELGASFLDLLEAVVADPRAHVAFMGHFNGFEAVAAARPRLVGRISFLGFRPDVLSVLRVCDACLNPDRTGGGRSGAYAQHAGLPVLTLGRGDVASTVGEDSWCESYDEMATTALRLIQEPAFLAQRREGARARAAQTIGVGGFVARILSEMEGGSARRSAGQTLSAP